MEKGKSQESNNLNLSWTALTVSEFRKLDTPFKPLMDKMEQIRKAHKRLLIINKDIYLPQSVVVVTIDKVYERYALAHSYDKLSGETLNYTINYGDLLDIKSGVKVVVEP